MILGHVITFMVLLCIESSTLLTLYLGIGIVMSIEGLTVFQLTHPTLRSITFSHSCQSSFDYERELRKVKKLPAKYLISQLILRNGLKEATKGCKANTELEAILARFGHQAPFDPNLQSRKSLSISKRQIALRIKKLLPPVEDLEYVQVINALYYRGISFDPMSDRDTLNMLLVTDIAQSGISLEDNDKFMFGEMFNNDTFPSSITEMGNSRSDASLFVSVSTQTCFPIFDQLLSETYNFIG